MSTTVRDIYNAALAIMNESDPDGGYAGRTAAIVNTLIGDCWRVSEQHRFGPHSTWKPVSSLDDTVSGIDVTLCLAAMPYGLAAMLYLDEDPVRSRSWWSVYQEQYEKCRRSPGSFESVEDLYGGVEMGRYGQW